ncbi:MAG: VOC family protein [Candidatus Pacebacteria bacterium]|nr:VOC family protein [Candidatus Paceibacterota bacterium]
MKLQKISPFLWFNGVAEAAAQHYVSIFPDSRIDHIARAPSTVGESASELKPGAVMVVNYTLSGMGFVGLNGGPGYDFNQAVSFVVNCQDQAEVDHYWDRLSDGGNKIQCGWLTDKFGLPWQIVPTMLFDYMQGSDREAAGRVFKAMLEMEKLVIADLEKAARG